MRGRAALVGMALIVAAVVFLMRLVYLQVWQADSFRQQVAQARLLRDLQPGQRGRIVDRHGTVLVDNRIAVDACLPLVDLAAERSLARQTTLLAFDQTAKQRLLTRLATLSQFSLQPEEFTERLEQAFAESPLVGRRRIKEERGVKPVMYLVPQAAVQAFVPNPDDAELLVAFRSEQLASLAAAGALRVDLRLMLQEMISHYYLDGVMVLAPEEFNNFLHDLSTAHSIPFDLMQAITFPLFQSVACEPQQSGQDPDELLPIRMWHILSFEGRQLFADALALNTGLSVAEIEEDIVWRLRKYSKPIVVNGGWLTDADGLQLLRETVADLPAAPLEIDGLAAGRSYVDFIQDEGPGDMTGFAGWCRRLAAIVGVSEQLLVGVVREVGERTSVASSQARFRVRHLILDEQRLDEFCRELARIARAHGMQVTPNAIRQSLAVMRLRGDRGWRAETIADPLPVLRDIPQSLIAELSELGGQLPDGFADFHGSTHPLAGLVLRSRPTRSYAFPKHASHLFGMLGRNSRPARATTALGLDPAGWVGRSGVESAYDEQLQGVSGRRWSWRGAKGYEDLPAKAIPARPGETVRLTIDMELQLAAEAALANWAELADDLGTMRLDSPKMKAAQRVGKGRAGLALMNVHNGELLALATQPQFDLRSIRSLWSTLADPELHPERPLNDYAVEGWESPGSTVKPFVALVGLHEGKLGLHEEIPCPGYMARAPNGDYILRDHAPPGDYNVIDAVAHSSNVFFAKLAKRIGPSELAKWYTRVGVGRVVAPDIPWQRPGVLPDPATRRPWLPAETWFMGIGQNLASSPLQIVTIPALVATGKIVVPHLVAGAAPQPWDQGFAPAHLRVVQQGMEQVTTNDGTAPKLQLGGPWADVKVAAKTGTSEWGSREMRANGEAPDNAWIVAYAPAERPQVAIAVYIRCGTSGGRACSGVTKAVLETYFARYGLDGIKD